MYIISESDNKTQNRKKYIYIYDIFQKKKEDFSNLDIFETLDSFVSLQGSFKVQLIEAGETT